MFLDVEVFVTVVVEKKLFEVSGDFSEYFIHQLFCFGWVFGFGVDTDKGFGTGRADECPGSSAGDADAVAVVNGSVFEVFFHVGGDLCGSAGLPFLLIHGEYGELCYQG